MKNFILLENIEIYANHGFFEQETIVGNTFIINLKAEVDVLEACKTDNLEKTVNYAEIYDIVKEEMMIPSKLIEHVGYRIIQRLKSNFERVISVELKISKKNPPITGQIEQASVVFID